MKKQYIVWQSPKPKYRSGMNTAVMVVDAESKAAAIRLVMADRPHYFHENDRYHCKVDAQLLVNWTLHVF